MPPTTISGLLHLIYQEYNADALSWNNVAVFFSQAPQATKDPIKIPNHLLQLVSLNQTWISTVWIRLFNATILQP